MENVPFVRQPDVIKRLIKSMKEPDKSRLLREKSMRKIAEKGGEKAGGKVGTTLNLIPFIFHFVYRLFLLLF
jgi:hypothetical protein